MEYYGVSERKACRVLGQCRATQRYESRQMDDEDHLRHCVIDLASKYGRYGYKRITALLKQEGWRINHKRVFRIWREEGIVIAASVFVCASTLCLQTLKAVIQNYKNVIE